MTGLIDRLFSQNDFEINEDRRIEIALTPSFNERATTPGQRRKSSRTSLAFQHIAYLPHTLRC